MFIKSVYTDIN